MASLPPRPQSVSAAVQAGIGRIGICCGVKSQEQLEHTADSQSAAVQVSSVLRQDLSSREVPWGKQVQPTNPQCRIAAPRHLAATLPDNSGASMVIRHRYMSQSKSLLGGSTSLELGEDVSVTMAYRPLTLTVVVRGQPAIVFNSDHMFAFEHLREKQVRSQATGCIVA